MPEPTPAGSRAVIALVMIVSAVSLAVVAALQAAYASGGVTLYGFGNMVVSDPMGNWLKCFATVAMMVTLVLAGTEDGQRRLGAGTEQADDPHQVGDVVDRLAIDLDDQVVRAEVDLECGRICGDECGANTGRASPVGVDAHAE